MPAKDLFIFLCDILASLYVTFFAFVPEKAQHFCESLIDYFSALKKLELASSVVGCLRLSILIRVRTRFLAEARGVMDEQLAHSVH